MTKNFQHIVTFTFAFITLFSMTSLYAAHRTIDLTVSYDSAHFAGKKVKTLTINHQIPAPTLHFKEGDTVTINVRNELDQETALHWHGLLVPWQMDGVLGINQQGIQPGGKFQYQFTLKQSGTYWYHAHAGLQEQQGLYGAFVIDPIKKPSYHYTKDQVIVLSDWSNTHPDTILSNLKKEGDYYSPRFPLQPSLLKFIHDYRKASPMERKLLVDDYKMMQQMRMSLYDLSDVAYDAFLLNGHPKTNPWVTQVKQGDIVRLRFIGAGGSTIFHVKIPGATMKMVHIQGNDVIPFDVEDFWISPGETYDVLVRIQKNEPYIIYAESIDTVGAAYGALVQSANQAVDYKKVKPFPEPLPVTRDMMALMMGKMDKGNVPNHASKTTNSHIMHAKAVNSQPHTMSHHDHAAMSHDSSEIHHKMNHASMSHEMKMPHDMPMNHEMKHGMNHDMAMPMEPTIIGDSIKPPTTEYATTKDTKYQNVVAAVKTNDPNKPIAGVINMELFGYMDRYIWFINGVPEHKAKPIVLNPGKRYRFVFTNTSMMHHPMHIHGHWFILRKGKNAYDPLLHTIDVPPGATITADVDTDASGQWIFHCHLLYHMMSGMARTFQYSTLLEMVNSDAKPEDIIRNTSHINRPIVRVDEVRPIDPALVKHPMAHPNTLWRATFLDVGINPVTQNQMISFKSLYGGDFRKLELAAHDADIKDGKVERADLDIFYWQLLDQFWTIKGGINYVYRPAKTPYWQLGMGIEGLMPYFIDTDIRGYFYRGSAKLDIELSRNTQITNNFFIRLGVRSILATKTIASAGIGSGLNEMQYTLRPYYRLMPGLDVFAEFEQSRNYGAFKKIQDESKENSLTFGLSVLF